MTDHAPMKLEKHYTCWIEVVESTSLVSVLFRVAFSHPYISFFHLLVYCFCVYRYVCGPKNLNPTIDSPFQTFAVGFLVEIID